MAASRSSSFRALRAVVANTQPTVPTKRALHITGVKSSPAFSPTGAAQTRASFNRSSLNDLQDECRRRTISTSGSKHELVERLINHDALQSRAFSIAMRKIAKDQNGPFGGKSPVEQLPTRHFNTSRAHKAVNDTSTIDFAYLPEQADISDSVQQSIRVPILPDAFETASPAADTIVHSNTAPVDGPVMKAEIYTVSDPDGSHVHLEESGQPKVSSMHEVVDNHAIPIDPYNLTETVNNAAKKLGGTVESAKAETENAADGIKRVWDGFVDDLFGEQTKTKAT